MDETYIWSWLSSAHSQVLCKWFKNKSESTVSQLCPWPQKVIDNLMILTLNLKHMLK